MALLATTALEWSWGKDEPIVFLGEWCRRYERTAAWRARDHIVVRNHWDDRGKLRRDQAYLERLHDELLGDLARTLGQLHGIERSKRFWQTLLDPWLARYLGVAFDRWESLRIAFEEHDISEMITRSARRHTPTRDHIDFTLLLTSDDWNHDLYADILRYEYSAKCTLRSSREPASLVGDDELHGNAEQTRGWKWQLACRVDRVLAWLARNNDVVLVQSYFPITALVILNLRLGQLPSLFLGEFRRRDPLFPRSPHCATELRSRISLTREATCRFESFLHARILIDLLQVLVEGFEWIRSRAKAIELRPKVVLTANFHWFNDLFKHWIAEQVHGGVLFVAMDHGNSIPPLFASMDFEEDIADVKTTWGLPYHPKHVQLPANKLVGRRRRRRRADGGRLVVVGSELPRYAFDASSTPIAGQVLVGFDYVCRLHDALDEAPRSALLVKPYPDLGWRIGERFRERLGVEKVTSEPSLAKVMRAARMVICTYPQTTFSEAMTCGAPALLVYPRHLWETVARFDGLLETLHQARIVFFDPQAAAEHLNSIWDDPTAWWDSTTVRAARSRFEEEALDMRTDWIRPWVRFTRGLRSGDATARTVHAGAFRRP